MMKTLFAGIATLMLPSLLNAQVIHINCFGEVEMAGKANTYFETYLEYNFDRPDENLGDTPIRISKYVPVVDQTGHKLLDETVFQHVQLMFSIDQTDPFIRLRVSSSDGNFFVEKYQNSSDPVALTLVDPNNSTRFEITCQQR